MEYCKQRNTLVLTNNRRNVFYMFESQYLQPFHFIILNAWLVWVATTAIAFARIIIGKFYNIRRIVHYRSLIFFSTIMTHLFSFNVLE